MTEARTEDAPAEPAPETEPEEPQRAPEELPSPSGGPVPDPAVSPRRRRWSDELDVPAFITFGIVTACVTLVVFTLGPANLLSDTTPAGGDMGAHVWAPAYLRDHLLDKFRLSGWTMDWYAGFPAFQFYMVIPSLVIAVLSWVLPYGVAFKLVAVSGCVTFPVACWFFGRCARLPFPAPALLAVGGVLFLFDRSFSIYGGNIPSTMAGEFAFSISLSIGMVYLGVLVRGLDTGRHRAWAAALLALTGLCHLLPLIFVLVCTLLYLIVRPGIGSLKYLVTTLPVAGALTAFWTVPFVTRVGYMNDMGWERITSDRYVNYLWSRERLDPQLLNSPDLRVVIAFAAVGLLLSIVFRRRTGLFLALVATAFAIGFMVAPQGRVWNARLLPFYYLALYLLAAVGVAEMIRLAAAVFARDLYRPVRAIQWSAPVAATTAIMVALLMSLHFLPGGESEPGGGFWWGIGRIGLHTEDRSFIDSWANWNFEGYEGLTTMANGVEQYRKSYPEYHDIVSTMATVGKERGCGRALWEHEEAHDRYGTPMALMLLPFWTDGCIGSMEGLYFEASATTPYHFLLQDEVSWTPSNAQREMPYGAGSPSKEDFDRGVRHLQMAGVRYYMAINANTQGYADESTALTRVAASGPWKVYEVADAPLVQSLENQPAVLTGQALTGRPWQDTAVCWWINPSDWDVTLTADGPAEWARVARTNVPDADATPTQKCQPTANWGWFDEGGGPEAERLPDAGVSNIVTSDDGISFDVERPGVPVLVKVSYFPNWRASGAQGPYRATPNFMVVVPDGNHVELHYGWTAIDLAAIALTLLGLVGLVALTRMAPVAVAPPGRFWGRAERPDLYPPPERERHDEPDNTVADWLDQFGPALPAERETPASPSVDLSKSPVAPPATRTGLEPGADDGEWPPVDSVSSGTHDVVPDPPRPDADGASGQ
jgi:hypothetical protein